MRSGACGWLLKKEELDAAQIAAEHPRRPFLLQVTLR